MARNGKNIDFDLWSFLTENVNPHRILTELYNSTDMTKDHCRKFTACASDQRLWIYILDCILQDKLSMSDFFRVLFKTGYTHIALQFSARHQHEITEIKSPYIEISSEKTFYKLKSQAYNKTLLPRDLCNLLKKYNCEPVHYHKNPELADKLAFVLCAGIDTVIMSFSEKAVSHPWFDFLNSVNRFTSNTQLFNVARHSRLAIACATTGDLIDAKKYLSAALVDSFGVSPCSVIINLYYFATYIKGCEFERDPTAHIKAEILNFIHLGLGILQTQSTEVQEYWTKMFLQRKIYCFLGLSNKAYPIRFFTKNSVEIDEANKLLAESDEQRKYMDDRRQQLYLVADARGYQFQNNISMALEKLEEAIFLDKRKVFGETSYIKKYKSDLESYRCSLRLTQSTENRGKQSEITCSKYVMRIETFDVTTSIYKLFDSDVDGKINLDVLSKIITFHGFLLPATSKDIPVRENNFCPTILEHPDSIIHFQNVEELRKGLCEFLKLNPLQEIAKCFDDFMSLSSSCFLSTGLANLTPKTERQLWEQVVGKIQEEEFCGAIEIWAVARFCNIPVLVLSFCAAKDYMEIASFHFKHESSHSPIIHIGHVYDGNSHSFFPLCKVHTYPDDELELEDKQKEQLDPNNQELIYDIVSRKLPPETPLFMFCGELDETLEKNTTPGTSQSEDYFQIMYKWHNKYPNIEHFKKLRLALSNLERQDVIQVIDDFQKIEFKEFPVNDQYTPVTDDDIRLVCSHITNDYRHLVRFLGLPQNVLNVLAVDHTDSVTERIYHCLKEVIRRKSLTRQDLCDGIEYASQNRDLIQKLNDCWKM